MPRIVVILTQRGLRLEFFFLLLQYIIVLVKLPYPHLNTIVAMSDDAVEARNHLVCLICLIRHGLCKEQLAIMAYVDEEAEFLQNTLFRKLGRSWTRLG